MEKKEIDYLPLGSIVILCGGIQKLIINARGVVIKHEEEKILFDYGGSLYPQGIIGDEMIYFNHEDIQKVVFMGYSDDDDKLMVSNIKQWYKDSEYKRKDEA